MTSAQQIDPASFDWASPTGAADGVRRVVAAATSADGSSPLDEAALLSLRHTGLSDSALWVIGATADGEPVTGFALADARPGSTGDVEVDLVVAPAARRHGLGRILADTVLDAFPDADLSAWSHGNHPAAARLAQGLGFDRARDLWVMRRSLHEPLPEVTAGPSVVRPFVVRPFEPGRDEQPLLEVNAAAFAHHPEQGAMTRTDLDRRMSEEWFDPAGLFLAVSTGSATGAEEGELLGFHWTKVHEDDPSYGEVYVVGVSPAAQGLGLGKALTLTGLHHLRSRGLGEVILYVESDNVAAVAVYRGLGFTHADEDTHVQYHRDHAVRT